MPPADEMLMEIRAEIRTVLDRIETEFSQGADVYRLMPMWYAPDVVTMGEGDPGALRGLEAQIAKAAEVLSHLGPRPRVRFRIDDPIVAWGEAAAILIETEVLPDLPGSTTVAQTMLTVWRRDPAGWRIVREMYVAGTL